MRSASGQGPAATVPSATLFGQLRAELMRHLPFARMDEQAVDHFLARAEQRYYAPGEVLVEPASGAVHEVFYIRRGEVTGVRGGADASAGAIQYEPGDLFPLGAALAARAVTATYSAVSDTFVLVVPVAVLHELAGRSAPLAEFLKGRTLQFLELSRSATQMAYASQALAEQSLETPLRELRLREPIGCRADTPLAEALAEMHGRRIGSIMVWDASRAVLGILTRNDVLGRITLAGVPLERPVREVMTQPVHTLDESHTAGDAALLMSRHAIRHVPITRGGVAVGLVSERDLFALQRLSLKNVSTSLRAAPDIAALRVAAQDIRRFARILLGQGVQARQLTTLISHLNDVLTVRLLEVVAAERAFELSRVCWLALGSEGRGEQTIATDQDNALILPDGTGAAGRAEALAFGRACNEALDACGYPLCRGGIMAGEAGCCMTLGEWRARFAGWIEHGAPEDLLHASIFFDLRALTGETAMADTLRAEVAASARDTPRFLKQLAGNALARGVPLNWLGALDTDAAGMLDLKLQGSALFVDAARLFALARGLPQTGTRERLEAVAAHIGLPAHEAGAWVGAFDFLQMLRLRVQLEDGTVPGSPNRIAVAGLNDIDRRILRESLRVARLLQQRIELDYER